MIENRKKVIREFPDVEETGYISDKGEFILHSFNDEPAMICDVGTLLKWYKDGLLHRDNNLPARIWYDGSVDFFKNGEEYWYINNEEYYDINDVFGKFKNNILILTVDFTTLKDNGIVDVIWLSLYEFLILDQAQYNLAVFKFL